MKTFIPIKTQSNSHKHHDQLHGIRKDKMTLMFGLLMALQKPKHVPTLVPNERAVLGQTCEHMNFSINYLSLILSFVYCQQ